MLTNRLSTESARPEHGPALTALFERNAVSCNCQWWHFQGDKNDWLERCALQPALNREAFLQALATPGPHGVVATLESEAVGWLKLTRAGAVTKLYEQRFYRGLPCFNNDRSRILTIGCLLVDEPWRKQGVAQALLARAIQVAAELEFGALEAFPRAGVALGDAEAWTGPLQMFLNAGFVVVEPHTAYPVLRRTLE
jgi:GNAT superfamily N-acetyltransferase